MKPNHAETVIADSARVRDQVRQALDELSRAAPSGAPYDTDRDAIRIVTGRSSMDRALDSARGMLDRLERSLRDSSRTLCLDATAGAGHRNEDDQPVPAEIVTRSVEVRRSSAAYPTA